MNIETAALISMRGQEAEDGLRVVLAAATQAEANAGEGQSSPASERFTTLGKRIVVLSGEPEHRGGSVRQEVYGTTVDLGVNGLSVALKARRNRVNASFMPWTFDDIEARWVVNGDTDNPIAVQEVGYSEVIQEEVDPQTLGMLRLMEQTVEAAVAARTSSVQLAASA